MTDKPTNAEAYPPELAVDAKRMCLYVATILGDLLDDVVVVGGLVPYVIVDQTAAPADARHVGTRDLDLGLALALLDENFASVDHVGPKRHAEFLGNRDDDVFRQDALGVVRAFLAAVVRRTP